MFSGVADLKKTFEAARARRKTGQGTLLFIDEIHRFNRSQQDSFLPVVEDGTVMLVGATTENPSFELNGALLSRAQVLVLRRLDDAALEMLLQRAEAHYGEKLPLTDDARASLRAMADGDGRYLLNLAEEVAALKGGRSRWTPPALDGGGAAAHAALRQEPRGALQHHLRAAQIHPRLRSRRGALLAGAHAGGRRAAALHRPPPGARGGRGYRPGRSASGASGAGGQGCVRFPGLARKANWRWRRCVLYLASAPKSNAVYAALGAAKRAAEEHGSLMPPAHILNAPTKLMKNLGYGAGYQYDHEAEEGFSGQNYFPDAHGAADNSTQPKDTGFEREIAKRLEYWAKLRAKKAEGGT